MKSYNLWSFLLVLIGGFISYMIFPPFNFAVLGEQSMWCIPLGMVIYGVGVSFSFVSLIKKEKGFLKYFSMASLILLVLFIVLLSYVFSGTI